MEERREGRDAAFLWVGPGFDSFPYHRGLLHNFILEQMNAQRTPRVPEFEPRM